MNKYTRTCLVAGFLLLAAFASAQTAVTSFVTPRQQFFSTTGAPLAGGKVYSYICGTSTLQATYTDLTGSVQNANPIILDSSGSATIAIAKDCYKFIGQNSAGVVQWTVDNVRGSAIALLSQTANAATAGLIQLAKSDLIEWRNNANSGNVTLGINGSDLICATSTNAFCFPAAADTAVGKATADTLTNKSYDTAGTGNVLKINGTQVSAVTGSGAVVLASSPGLSAPTIGGGSAINKVLIAEASLTFGLLGAQTCGEQSIAVTGALQASGVVSATPKASITSTGLSWSAWVAANDVVNVRVCNITGAGITPNVVTWRAVVIQ